MTLLGILTGSAVQARLSKRQNSDCVDFGGPVECSSFSQSALDDVAFENPSQFVTDYCGATCGQPLYDYYKQCDEDTGNNNATKLDFFCANSNGNACIEAIFTELISGFSGVFIACVNVSSDCFPECRSALSAAQARLGCCFYSYYALVGGPRYAAILFNLCEISGDYCTGGLSNETLVFREDIDVDDECKEFVSDVPERCRYLLEGALLEYFGYLDRDLDGLCDGYCSNAVYQFYSRCDEVTEQENATQLDLLCANNNNDTRCGDEIIAEFSAGNPLDACGDFNESCPVECTNAFQQLLSNTGCCFYTYMAIEGSPTNARNIFQLCGVETGDYCTGHFTNETIDPSDVGGGDKACQHLTQKLRSDCLSYTSIETLISIGYVNPDFISNFCNSVCAIPVYDYFRECDLITRRHNAPYVDFLCAKNTADTDCVGILSDTSLFAVFDTTCEATTDKLCTDDCSDALQQPATDWGCCLFTFTALNDNITYTEGIVEQCKLPENIGLCSGAFSGGPVKVPTGFVDSHGTCEKLAAAIPEGCDEFISEVAILEFAYSDPTALVSNFCKSGCAKPIFEYVKNCFKLTRDSEDAAAYINLLCSSDSRLGSQCAGILSDEFVSNTVESLCQDATADSCSDACSIALQESSGDWGCCLYTLQALDTNVTFVNDIYDRCKVESSGLCEGALSGAPILTPSIEDAALNTAVSSAMIVATAMLLALVL